MSSEAEDHHRYWNAAGFSSGHWQVLHRVYAQSGDRKTDWTAVRLSDDPAFFKIIQARRQGGSKKEVCWSAAARPASMPSLSVAFSASEEARLSAQLYPGTRYAIAGNDNAWGRKPKRTSKNVPSARTHRLVVPAGSGAAQRRLQLDGKKRHRSPDNRRRIPTYTVCQGIVDLEDEDRICACRVRRRSTEPNALVHQCRRSCPPSHRRSSSARALDRALPVDEARRILEAGIGEMLFADTRRRRPRR